jgi:hypothetical protein
MCFKKTQMKIVNLFSAFIAIIILISCKPSPQKAVEYNDKIVDEINKMRTAEDSLGNAIVRFEEKDLEAKLNNYISQAETGIKTISAMEKFDKKDDLKNAATSLLEFYKKSGQNEFKSVLEIARKPEKTEDDIKRVSEILEGIDPKQAAAIENFSKIQHAFATEYRIMLENPGK